MGRDRIEGLADLIVTGDLLDLEEALGVASPLGLLAGPFLGEDRKEGDWVKKDREGAQTEIRHRIMGRLSPVRRSGKPPSVRRNGTHQVRPTRGASCGEPFGENRAPAP